MNPGFKDLVAVITRVTGSRTLRKDQGSKSINKVDGIKMVGPGWRI